MSDLLRDLEERLRRARDRAAALTAPTPKQIGPYEIVEALGEGGMGHVYRARHESLGREVALKLIRTEHRFASDARERFLREARVASRLDHKNLCRVYEFGEHEGLPWFAMQLIEGTSLAERIEDARVRGEKSVADPRELAALFAKIADALHVAHENGLVHRDIKPGNIVIRPDGEPVVLDFGIARDASGFDQTLTASGQMLGTPLYLPPEQVTQQGARDDRRWDVYSTAVTLYECLTLERPYDGDSASAIFDAILDGNPARIRKARPDVTRDLEIVVLTAMDSDPSRRYPDCARLAADLRRAAQGVEIEARAPSLVLRTRRWVRANPVAASVLSVLAIATLATGTQWLRAEKQIERFNLLAANVQLDELRDDPAMALTARPENVAALRTYLDERVGPLFARRPAFVAARDALRTTALPYDEEQRAKDARSNPQALELASATALRTKILGFMEAIPDLPIEEADKARRRMGAKRSLERVDRRIAALREDEGALRTHAFSHEPDKYLHDGLERLLRDLSQFERRDVARVRGQLDWAERVRSETVEGYASEWKESASRIATDPRFDGITLVPQLGLVPLGPDPVSGLEEFALLRSGSVPIRTDADKALEYREDSAIVFVLLPPSKARIGSRPRAVDPQPEQDEFPQHSVSLDAFFLAKHETTQAQWRALAQGSEPSKYRAGTPHGGVVLTLRHPVEQVSWQVVTAELHRHALDLPTEVQWESACRAGRETPWWTGDAVSSLQGCENLGDRAAGRFNASWLKIPSLDDGHGIHAPVGSFRPNPFGLYDMHGNVREWCRDPYWQRAYEQVAQDGDGLRRATLQTDTQVTRGGAFDYDAWSARSARRDGWPPTQISANQGFRAARRLEH